MHRTKTLALSLGLALGGGVAWFARGVGAADPIPSNRVAVVDMLEVMNASPRKRAIEQQRRDLKASIDAYKQEQGNKFRDMYGEIEKTAKADPKRKKLEEDTARLGAMAEFEIKWRLNQADVAYGDALENLYAEVKGYIREVAQANSYSTVLFKTDDPLNLEKAGEFILSVAMRPVLYYDRAVDITALVKARVEAAKPAGGTPPVAPAPAPAPPRRPPELRPPAPAPVPPGPVPAMR